MKDLLSGVRSRQMSIVLKHSNWQFPYRPWINPRFSTGLHETLCVCTGLSENPHIRGAEVSGVPSGLLSEVHGLLKSSSCHSITVNGETLRQEELSEESFV